MYARIESSKRPFDRTSNFPSHSYFVIIARRVVRTPAEEEEQGDEAAGWGQAYRQRDRTLFHSDVRPSLSCCPDYIRVKLAGAKLTRAHVVKRSVGVGVA